MASVFTNTGFTNSPATVNAVAHNTTPAILKRKREDDIEIAISRMPGAWIDDEDLISMSGVPDISAMSYTSSPEHPSTPSSLASSERSSAMQTPDVATPAQRSIIPTPRVDSAIALDLKPQSNGSRKRRKVEIELKDEPKIPNTPSASPSARLQAERVPSKQRVNCQKGTQTDVGNPDNAFADAPFRQRAANDISTRAAQSHAFDFIASPGNFTLYAQLEASRQELAAVKERESSSLLEIKQLKQDKLDAEKEQRLASAKHSAEIAASKKEIAGLERTIQLNKDEAEKQKKWAEAAEQWLRQVDVDRKAETEEHRRMAEVLRQRAAFQLDGLVQQANIKYNEVVGELQQQLSRAIQERDEQLQAVPFSKVQVPLIRKLLWDHYQRMHDTDVLGCPIQNRLKENASQSVNLQNFVRAQVQSPQPHSTETSIVPATASGSQVNQDHIEEDQYVDSKPQEPTQLDLDVDAFLNENPPNPVKYTLTSHGYMRHNQQPTSSMDPQHKLNTPAPSSASGPVLAKDYHGDPEICLEDVLDMDKLKIS